MPAEATGSRMALNYSVLENESAGKFILQIQGRNFKCSEPKAWLGLRKSQTSWSPKRDWHGTAGVVCLSGLLWHHGDNAHECSLQCMG